MSKLRNWLLKEERAGSPVTVDPAIKLFGATIAFTGGCENAHTGKEVIRDNNPSSRQTCTQVG
jgi:hypothetical protein